MTTDHTPDLDAIEQGLENAGANYEFRVDASLAWKLLAHCRALTAELRGQERESEIFAHVFEEATEERDAAIARAGSAEAKVAKMREALAAIGERAGDAFYSRDRDDGVFLTIGEMVVAALALDSAQGKDGGT